MNEQTVAGGVINAASASDHTSAPPTPADSALMAGLADPAAATPPGELADVVASIAEPLDLLASSFGASDQPCEIEAEAAVKIAATDHGGRLDSDIEVTDDPLVNALDRIEVAVETLTERFGADSATMWCLEVQVEALAERVDTNTAAIDGQTEMLCDVPALASRWRPLGYLAEVAAGAAVLVLIAVTLLPIVVTTGECAAVAAALAMVGYLTLSAAEALRYALGGLAGQLRRLDDDDQAAEVYALTHDNDGGRRRFEVI